MKVYADPQTHSYTVKKLPFYLRRSFYVHIALFSLTLIGGKIISVQQEKLRERNLELVQASVRVDMVAMPKYTLAELKNISSGVEEAKKEEAAPMQETAKKEEPKPEPVKEEPKAEKQAAAEADNTQALEIASKKKKIDFLSKLKEIGNKKIKGEGNVKAEKGLYGEKNTDLKQLILSGNKISKGVAITGSGSAEEMSAFKIYAAKLPQVVQPHWSLPDYLLKEKNLKCRVRVWISQNGEITRAEVYQSSGNDNFDSRAVQAVKSTGQFPRLPEELIERGRNGNIILGFPL